jgi:hypothetical protein
MFKKLSYVPYQEEIIFKVLDKKWIWLHNETFKHDLGI